MLAWIHILNVSNITKIMVKFDAVLKLAVESYSFQKKFTNHKCLFQDTDRKIIFSPSDTNFIELNLPLKCFSTLSYWNEFAVDTNCILLY